MRRDVFQAIADPVRRDIISLLTKEPLSINAVADQFDISRPAISKHLKILKECKIIDIHQNGRQRICEIKPKSLLPVAEWMAQYQQFWEEKLDSFEVYLNELQTKKHTDE
jgi:DNA-binding transcriptional ArsR family regulator